MTDLDHVKDQLWARKIDPKGGLGINEAEAQLTNNGYSWHEDRPLPFKLVECDCCQERFPEQEIIYHEPTDSMIADSHIEEYEWSVADEHQARESERYD